MKYELIIKPKVSKDIKNIDKRTLSRILDKLELLRDNLTGNVKHLTNFSPEYRLRVGVYRVLFEVENDTIFVYRIKHRKNVYR